MEEADKALEAVIDGLMAAGEDTVADTIEEEEGETEDQFDSGKPDLAVIARAARDMLSLLDQAASRLQISP